MTTYHPLVRSWLRHAWVYVVINGFLVAVWAMTNGSVEQLNDMFAHPVEFLDAKFWPIWPILGWGVGLALHLTAAIGGRKLAVR